VVTFRTRDNVLAALPRGPFPHSVVNPVQATPQGSPDGVIEAPEIAAFTGELLVQCSQFVHLHEGKVRVILGAPGVGVGVVVYELYLYCPAEDCYIGERRA
jgi:hypothetical protein